MKRSQLRSANPDVQRVVEGLIKSVAKFDLYENRSAHREHLVVPTEVLFRETGVTLLGLTRNVSATGVGLLLPEACSEGDRAIVTMERADGSGKSGIISECRWCKPFGKYWFFSGWQFIQVQR